LLAGLLAGSHYPSGRSCCRPSRHRFSWFSSGYKQILRCFPIFKLLLSTSYAALQIKLIKTEPHCCHSHQYHFSKLYSSSLIQKIKILPPLSQVTATDLSTVFTFTLLLLEGRAGEAWGTSNKIMPSLLLAVVSHFSHDFSLSLIILLYSLPLCLTNFKRL
jgi:hypothetical protein